MIEFQEKIPFSTVIDIKKESVKVKIAKKRECTCYLNIFK